MPTQSFLRILELLDQHGVEYIVVGGVAAVLQGAPVTTFDIDTLVKVDAANADRLAAALAALDALFGSPDDLKLKSCATLFAAVSPAGSVFERLLDAFFQGNRDEKTLRLISGG